MQTAQKAPVQVTNVNPLNKMKAQPEEEKKNENSVMQIHLVKGQDADKVQL